MSYLGNSPGVASQRIVTTFTATAGQTTFTPSSGYALGYCDVFQNGVKLVNGDDYTASNGTTVVLATGASAGDSVEVVAFIPRGLSDGYTKAEADTLLNAKQNSLGYTPVNKAGDTMTGNLKIVYSGATARPQVGVSDNSSFDRLYMRWNDAAGGAAIRNSDNTPLRLGTTDIDRIIIDAAGRVTMPYQPMFSVAYSEGTTISSGTGIAPTPTRVIHNVGAHYNPSNGRFTAPVTGRYLFVCQFAGYGSFPAQPYWSAELWINGSRRHVGGWADGDGGYAEVSHTFVVELNAGDYAQLGKEFHTAGMVEGGNDLFPVFSGYLLG